MSKDFFEFAEYFSKCAAEFDEDQPNEMLESLSDKEMSNNFLDSRIQELSQSNNIAEQQLRDSQERGFSIKELYESLDQEEKMKKQELVDLAMQKNQALGELDQIRQEVTDFLIQETQSELPEFDPSQIPGANEFDDQRAAQLDQQKFMEQQQIQQEMAMQQQKMMQQQMMMEQMRAQSGGGQMDPSMIGGQPPMDPGMMGGQPPMGKMGFEKNLRFFRVIGR